MAGPAVAVVVTTYNRADLLGEALDSLLDQQGAPEYEVVVVDNNSTDATRSVAQRAVARSRGIMRYVFEPRQGISHGRNAGVLAAHAPLLAFTDDDVRASPTWVATLARAFAERPWADYLGGKVLPRWPRMPPPWLTAKHWAPLALVDYGDAPRRIDLSWYPCMVGANLAIRRSAFARVGLFHPSFHHRKGSVSAIEDSEFQLRLLVAGGVGAYVPELVIHAAVQENRLERWYHRKWHLDHGRASAALEPLLQEIYGRTGAIGPPRFRRWPFAIPPYLIRALAGQVATCAARYATGRAELAFEAECEVRELLGGCRGRLSGEHRPVSVPAPRLPRTALPKVDAVPESA